MAQAQPATELSHLASQGHPSSEQTWHAEVTAPTEIEQVELPPTDTGRAAWLVLAGCSLIQLPVWGTQLLLVC